MRRLAGICAAILVIAALYVWYGKSRDNWYAGAYANGHLLRVAIRDDNPPFSFLDGTGSLAGFDVDIAHALCEKIQVKCRFLPQNWADSPVTFLLNGRYDVVVSSLPITKAGLQYVSFTDKYYSFPARVACCGPEANALVSDAGHRAAPWRFVARKGAAIEISPAGLAGKRVGIESWAGYDDYLKNEYPDAVRVRYVSQAAANLDMAAGRIDLLLADSRTLTESFLKTELGKDSEFAGPAITDPLWLGSDAGIAVRKDDTELLKALNQALLAIRVDGTYQKINARYFDFDVYGN